MNDKNIHILVLAAGLSRRMGAANKLLLPYKNHSIIREVLSELQKTSIAGITVVLGHEKEKVAKEIEGFAVELVFNPDFANGQSSSIQAGVKSLGKEVDGFLIGLGDMPKITSSDYQAVIDEFSTQLCANDAVIFRPFREKIPGHPVGFASRYRNKILGAEENDGCRSVILENKQHLVKWNTTSAVYFLDIDTKEDYGKVVDSFPKE